MTEDFLREVLVKMGVELKDQEEIIKNFRNTLFVTLIGIMKDAIPADKQQEVSQMLDKSEDWVKTLSESAQKYGQNKWLVDETNKRLKEKVDEFLGTLVQECPEDKKAAVLEYVDKIAVAPTPPPAN